MGNGDAGDLRQPVAQRNAHLVGTALALVARHQAHIGRRVILALQRAGVDRGVEVFHLGHFAQHGFHLAGLAFGEFQRGTDRGVVDHAGFRVIRLRHEFAADQSRHRNRKAAEEGGGGDQQRLAAMLQRPAQQHLVHIRQPLHHVLEITQHAADGLAVPAACVFAMRCRIVPDGRQHRIEREGDEHRNQHCRRDRHAELVEEAADDAAHETHRQEHRDDREGGGHHRQADFSRAFQRSRLVILVASMHLHARMAHDVFPHHDRVVDQETDAQRQRHQRNHVDGEAEHVHEEEGADQRHRQRESGDDGGTPRIEEEEDDQYRQHRAFDQRAAHVFHADTDLARTVADHIQLYARILGLQYRLQLLHRRLQAIDHLDGVLALRFHDVKRERALPVEHRQAFLFFLAVDHGSDLRQEHRLAAAAGDDDAAEIRRILHPALDLHHLFIGAGTDRAARQFLVFIAHRVDDLVDADALRFHLARLHIDVDFSQRAAHQGDRTDAAHVLQSLLHDLVGDGRQVAHAARLGSGFVADGYREDRLARRVVARHLRLFHLLAEGGADGGDFLAHVLRCLRRVDGQLEFDDDHRRAFVRARGEGIDAADGIDGFLHLARNVGFHRFRRGAGIVGLHHHHREGHIRKLVDLQPLIGKEAEHEQRGHHHGGEYGVADADAGEPHGQDSCSARAPVCVRL